MLHSSAGHPVAPSLSPGLQRRCQCLTVREFYDLRLSNRFLTTLTAGVRLTFERRKPRSRSQPIPVWRVPVLEVGMSLDGVFSSPYEFGYFHRYCKRASETRDPPRRYPILLPVTGMVWPWRASSRIISAPPVGEEVGQIGGFSPAVAPAGGLTAGRDD
jgi:hypothetical protein